MKVYLDDDFKCHITDDRTMRPYETHAFDGKCAAYIEGYRIVPDGETWTREDGEVFTGEMITPWKDYALLEAAQTGYEESLISANKAYEEGVNSI